METITIKMEGRMLEEIDQMLEAHRYSTRTEFVRDAIRNKLSQLEKQDLLKKVAQAHGSSKRKTTDSQRHVAGEKAVAMLEKKFNIK